MVEVSIADIVTQERTDEETGKSFTRYIVVLLDEQARRMLPIWIGPLEGPSIAMGLKDFQVPRPLTHTFAANLFEALGARLEEVRIESLKGDTFYAVAKLRRGRAVTEVDARPSDALALAVRTGSPIYVADELMQKVGFDIPAEVGEKRPMGKGLASAMSHIEEEAATWRSESEKSAKEAGHEHTEKMEQHQGNLIDLVVQHH